MFAIIKTGGKQFKVSKDQQISVEKLDGKAGDKVTIEDVLLTSDGKTTSTAPKQKVTAEIVEQTRDDKVIVFKKKRRQNYRRKAGHKQHKTILKITDIK